jgi:hypothetical protein
LASKTAAETGPVWDDINASGPRCGVLTEEFNFRRFEELPAFEGSNSAGAEGASDFLVDQNPTL